MRRLVEANKRIYFSAAQVPVHVEVKRDTWTGPKVETSRSLGHRSAVELHGIKRDLQSGQLTSHGGTRPRVKRAQHTARAGNVLTKLLANCCMVYRQGFGETCSVAQHVCEPIDQGIDRASESRGIQVKQDAFGNPKWSSLVWTRCMGMECSSSRHANMNNQ